jgi:outer membrane protein TolC
MPADWRAELQPALADDAATSLATATTLNLALRLALERNPEAQAARQRWRAAIATIPQAASLPDPMIEGGVTLTEPMAGLDRGWTFGIRQELPWWRALWARGRAAGADAGIAQLQYEIALRDLAIDVKNSCYELYYLDRAIEITLAIEDLLINEGMIAYGELKTGRTQISEAFRAKSEAAQLAYQRLLLGDRRAAEAERLRGLLNLPPETAIGPAAGAPVYPVSENLTELMARGEEYAQALKIAGLEIERANYEKYLAELARIPDISVGWMNEANVPAMMGRTMRSATGGMNLPIWEQRNRALIREKEALAQAAQLEAMGELNMTRQAIAEAWLELRAMRRLTELYRNELLPQAEAVLRQAETLFRNDQASFANVLETTMAWRNYQLAYCRAVADLGKAIGALERAIGGIVPPPEGAKP